MIKAHFHHIRLNAINVNSTIEYYQKYFGAKPIKYRGKSDALFTEKSFFLIDKVDSPPPTNEGSSLWHIGWSGVDGPSEFDWRVKEGINVHSPVTPLADNHWMYFWGPNNEVIEIFTGNKNHTFEHLHLLATDVNITMEWFKEHLGLSPVNEKAQQWPNGLFKWNHLLTDNINIYVYGKPVEERSWFPKEFKPTEGTAIDHIGFSFKNIVPVFEKMKASGVEIVMEIKKDPLHGLKSFFVRAPNQLLVEIVEEKPIPEGIWE